MKIDLRDRCERCNKMPRGELKKKEFEKYTPYSSYHREQWSSLERARARSHLDNIKQN